MENESKPKTYQQAKLIYEGLAKQCTEMVASRPRVQAEIEKRVKKEMGDFEGKLTALMKRKAEAAKEMHSADDRERPQREAELAEQTQRQVEQEQTKLAKRNATRAAERDALQTRSIRDAVGV